jgi:hypothetical protein
MLSFFRQHRAFRIEQGVGFFMCSAALVYLFSPQSAVYRWVEETYNFTYLPAITVGGLLICGWILAARKETTWGLYLVLTLPILIFPLINSWYSLVNLNGTLLGAYFVFGFWFLLQVIRGQQDQILNFWQRK